MVTSQSDERALVYRAQRADADAVAVLYQRFSPAIFRYFYLRVRDGHTAEDLTGEVFLKMVEGLPRYLDRDLPFAAWLFRIAHARLVDHFRRSRLRQSVQLSETLSDEHDGPEEAALQRVEIDTLYRRLRGLTDEQQLVIQLRFIEGNDLALTAATLGKTTGAIKSLQHRALQQLAQLERTQ